MNPKSKSTNKTEPKTPKKLGPIGVFDSGFGGLSVLKAFKKRFPQYDFIYLGDNARAPYGVRSFDTIFKFTWEGVHFLLEKMHCPLVILACNTASARALRQIQQTIFLPWAERGKRVLGIIRPTVEALSPNSRNKHVGILATSGTVISESYVIEANKLAPELTIHQQACPVLATLVESGEIDSPGTHFFVEQYTHQLLDQDPKIDTILLGCTHYPLLMKHFREIIPEEITILSQGKLVADSLADYLQRHPEIDNQLSKKGERTFYTTDVEEGFAETASLFMDENFNVESVEITNEGLALKSSN